MPRTAFEGTGKIGRQAAERERLTKSVFGGLSVLSQSEAEAIVDKHKEGKIWNSYGPSILNKLEVWEIWVERRGEYYTRFVATDSKGGSRYFSDFAQLASFAQGRFSELEASVQELTAKSSERKAGAHGERVKLYVAALVFVGSWLALLIILFKGIQSGVAHITILASIIASGGAMFFGKWKQFKPDHKA